MPRPNEPTLIAPLAQRLVACAVERGVPRTAMLAALEVDDASLADAEARIPARTIYAAWEVAMRALRNDGFPVEVGGRATVAGMGLLGYVLYTRPTVESAIHAMARYMGILNDSGHWSIRANDAETEIVWDRPGARSLGMRVANEQVIASFVAIGTQTDRGGHTVLRVSFRHDRPRSDDAHEAFFGVAPTWGADRDSIVIPRSSLDARPVGADAMLATYFDQTADKALARIATEGTWAARVARVVASALVSGIPTATEVARTMSSSERTMRRRLADEGASFDALVVQVQRAQADELLAGDTPIHDIAFAVGFADATAFSRAYRRWTGKAPSRARKR